jgi:hypothetical protein
MSEDSTLLNRRDFIRSTVTSVTGLAIGGVAGIAKGGPGELIDSSLLQYQERENIKLPLKSIGGIAIDTTDRIYVSGDLKIVIYNRYGTPVRKISLEDLAHCIAVDESGDVFLGMSDHVGVYDSDGHRKARWQSPGERALLTSISLSSDSVYTADAGQQAIWQYDKSGRIVRKVGEKNEAKDIPGLIIPSPYFAVDVDPDGFLWAANTGRHCLENYTMDGGMRTTWGQAASTIDGFCGCCNPSHFCIMPDGSFVTSEKGTPRVKVYDRLGNLAAIVALPDQFDPGTVGLDLAVDSKQTIHVLDPKRRLVRVFEKKA